MGGGCFPGSSAAKESACNAGDPSSIPGLGRCPGEGIDYPLQCSWASLVVQSIICLQCGKSVQFILKHLSTQPAMVSVVRGWDPPVGKMYCHPRAQRVGKDQAVRHKS